jgi:mRNA interferase RelE/StbE
LKKFTVQLTNSAVEDFNLIPEIQRVNIITLIKGLSSNPFTSAANIKKLKGFKPPLYRMRAGDFRVIYRVKEKTIIVMRVIDRKGLEKIIKRLKLSKS